MAFLQRSNKIFFALHRLFSLLLIAVALLQILGSRFRPTVPLDKAIQRLVIAAVSQAELAANLYGAVVMSSSDEVRATLKLNFHG
jgi:hypothetical protein